MNYFDKMTLTLVIDGSTAGVSMRCRIAGQTRAPKQLRWQNPSWWSTHVPEPLRTRLSVLLFVFWLGDLSAWVIHLLS